MRGNCLPRKLKLGVVRLRGGPETLVPAARIAYPTTVVRMDCRLWYLLVAELAVYQCSILDGGFLFSVPEEIGTIPVWVLFSILD